MPGRVLQRGPSNQYLNCKSKVNHMNIEDLKNKVGFQINFILHSGLEPETAIEHITELAEDYRKSTSELTKYEIIQQYLLERGANDEFVNNEILILKGLKERECKHRFITSADWSHQKCSECGFKVEIVNKA